MKHLCSSQARWRVFGAALALILLQGSGCADPNGGALGSGEQALTTPVWSHCANYRDWCAFSGTRQVRLGRDGRYTTGTFTNGVSCRRSSFPSSNLNRWGNHCEVDVSVQTPTEEIPSAGTGSMPMAGAPAPAPTPTPTPTVDAGTSVDAGHDMHTMPMGDMSLAPFIDTTKIPTGDPGSSEVFITNTGEQPAASDGTGAFRTVCLFSHMNFDDPLVFPGQPGASHLHAFFGNTGTKASSTPESIKTSGNSTCRGGIANRTAYWVPGLIDKNGAPQKPLAMDVYYKTGYKLAPSTIRPFPEKLRMLAGNPKASAPQDFVYWACQANGAHVNSIPTNCPAGSMITMTLVFPQCWDGKNLDSADHRSHVLHAWDPVCPSTHPVPIPQITYNVHYRVPSTGTAGWRLASDMYDKSLPGGYSVHGDWMEGWDPAVSKTFVERCDTAAKDCHSHLLGDGRVIYNPREQF